MTINILTLFPDFINEYFNCSIASRAIKNEHIEVNVFNIRDFSMDKHASVDDAPFGGGAGMLMCVQPLIDCTNHVKERYPNSKVIYLSPCGDILDNKVSRELAEHESLILVCGHYEGIDQRYIDEIVDMEISVGDYVLTGGELPALILSDAVMRFIPGVLGAKDVHMEESFEDNLLEYPQYTRPADYKGLKVPEILLTGHHANIKKWQREKQIELTYKRRPDLLKKAIFSENDTKYLDKLKELDKD